MPEAKSQTLTGRIGLFSASNIVIANMIGAGIFTTSGLLMTGLNNPVLLIVLWVGGGVLALCGALAYAELGASMPYAGGEYIFLSRLYHPLAGFLSGWVSFIVGFSAPIAASAIGFSEYFIRAYPQFQEWNKVMAISVILLFTLVHLKGMSFGSGVQNILTILKVLLIVFLILAGLAFGRGTFQHFTPEQPFHFSFSSIKTIGLSLMWIMFAYSGWNASTYIGSEIRNPLKNLPRSLFLGTGIVILLYVLLNIVYVYAIQPNEMKDVISIGGLAVQQLFGNPFEVAFSLMIAFALFSSLSAFIILGPRVYYSMAKEGLFFGFLAKVSTRYKVPWAAIVLQAVIAMIMVVSGTFDQILTYMGFSLGFFPIMAVAGVFRLRIQKKSKLPIRGHWIYLPVYLMAALAILILSYFERPVESSIALLTIVSGIPVYYLFKRYNKVKQ